MDDTKWFFKKIIKLWVVGLVAVFIVIALYGSFIYFQTQTIESPKKCFVTSMHKVNLCPGSEDYVRYKMIPKHFFHTLILSEDASFYSHKGFDWFEIKESFRRNIIEWRFARGGSTLTQQLAKNLYLTPEKSIGRKFKEIFLSKQIEKSLSKTQILEKYANVVEFGENIYGLKSASEKYFNKSPALLNILESIYLVSLLPSPRRLGRSFNKRELSKNNRWRMKIILRRLYHTKKINDEIYIYLQMLIEDEPWPFNNYSDDLFEAKQLSIEEQMNLEFEEADYEPDDFNENDGQEDTTPDSLPTESSQDPESKGDNYSPEESEEESIEENTVNNANSEETNINLNDKKALESDTGDDSTEAEEL